MSITDATWRTSRYNAHAHIVTARTNVAICGRIADGPTVAAGRPCLDCLAIAADTFTDEPAR